MVTSDHDSVVLEALMVDSFQALNKGGVGGQSWHQYNQQRGARIPGLLKAFKSGRYLDPHIRRV